MLGALTTEAFNEIALPPDMPGLTRRQKRRVMAYCLRHRPNTEWWPSTAQMLAEWQSAVEADIQASEKQPAEKPGFAILAFIGMQILSMLIQALIKWIWSKRKSKNSELAAAHVEAVELLSTHEVEGE